MGENKNCQHPQQEEISIEFCDDGMYRRMKCEQCGDSITEYYDLVNIHDDTKGVELPIPGQEREREENFQRYMLLGSYCDDNRPNIEVVYIDTDLNKVVEVMRLIEKINEASEEEAKKELALKAKNLGIAIIDDYEQVDEIEKLQIIKPVTVEIQDYHTTKEVND